MGSGGPTLCGVTAGMQEALMEHKRSQLFDSVERVGPAYCLITIPRHQKQFWGFLDFFGFFGFLCGFLGPGGFGNGPGVDWDSFGQSFSPNGPFWIHLGSIFDFQFWEIHTGSHFGPNRP